MTDDVQGYFYKAYPDGDPRKTPERRIVGDTLNRQGVTSMNTLCEMSGPELAQLRNIGEKRRATLLEVITQYKREKQAAKK